MGVVGDTVLCGPLLHTGSDCIGNLAIQTGAIVHHINHLLKDILWQILVHLLTVEDFLAKVLSGSFTRSFYVEGFLLERLSDNLKS